MATKYKLPITDSNRQREFVFTIVEFLDNPVTVSAVTPNNLEEAYAYIQALKGTNKQIDEITATKITAKLIPEAPKSPPGYKTTTITQQQFLNEMKPTFNNPSKLAKLPDNKLDETLYYARLLGNREIETKIFQEKERRTRPPFRPPVISRPDMPFEAGIPSPELISLLVSKIYIGRNVDKQNAYKKFIEVFLTDWMNRKGFIKNGKEMKYTPYFDNPNFLVELQKYIDKQLEQCEEKPNPKTLKKLPGNSTRQKLLKDIRERITIRLDNLMKEEYNRFILQANYNGGRRKTIRKTLYRKKFIRKDTLKTRRRKL